MPGILFLFIAVMLRLLNHIIDAKFFLPEILNGWLTYTLSQPVNLDLGLIIVFALQYFGISRLATMTQPWTSKCQEWLLETSESEEEINDATPGNLSIG